ncbi:MAG: hypothetical protein AB1679_10800 [Actinomycetota bacterium]
MDQTPQPALVDVQDLALILELLRHSALLADGIESDPRIEGAYVRLGRACNAGWDDTDKYG